MGTGIAYYVRTADASKLKPFLEGFLFKKERVDAEPPLPFVRVVRVDAQAPLALLAEISARLSTDVIWLAFQSTVDAFQYLHWQKGTLVRALTYGMVEQGLWEQVEGTIEPWERTAFPAEAPSVGGTEPMIDARETARALAQHFGLPGWFAPGEWGTARA